MGIRTILLYLLVANNYATAGNDFPVKDKYHAKNLHSVWDSVLYKFNHDFDLPL